jgi:enoyl-CoA hydratase/carnithine racemase
VFSADDALTYGFATRICEEPRQVAMETAREIASRSPSAIEAAKRLLNRVPDLPEAEALLLESVEQDAIIGKSNQIEAVMSQKEGREARFQAARGR